ncbi:glycoside hydrolase superfamily [Mycena leptocephala]|nr:glycoside hydrolase superfamily [Mycena leptocephala]
MHVSRTCVSHNLLLLAAIASNLVTSSPAPMWMPALRQTSRHFRDLKRDDDDEHPLSTDDEGQNEPNQGSDPGEDADDEAITPGSQTTLGGASSSKDLASSVGVAAAASGSALASVPRFIIYAIDSIPPASSLKASGVFNVLIIAFLSGDADGPKTNNAGLAQTWAGMTPAQRQEYKDAGITVLISLFGWTAKPTTSNWDPTTTANMMAAWVKANGLDGIDVDYEDTAAMYAGTGEAWVITFTTQLRNQLGTGYILTHAPMAPWWAVGGKFPSGGYRKIDQSVGSMIDWYNVQFYNSADTYLDCTTLVQETPDQTSALQINSEAKVPLNKIVIGKPLSPGDGGTYTDISTLSSCLQTAKAAGWDAGISFWKYADNATAVMTQARTPAFPL